MSAGAVFKLIANDGKADRMIMATKLLNQRIKDIMCERSKQGNSDITPTLVDLERTHIIYVNAHFKPFAAIGYEYNKVTPQNGSNSLGSSVTFSIPQFGDFFHDMVCRVRLSSVRANVGTAPTQGQVDIYPTNFGAHDYTLVDGTGRTPPGLVDGSPYRNLVHYCEYPGNRLFRLVKFDVNGNPLDQYDYMIPTMLEKFCTPPNKRIGHDRLVGQEVPIRGYRNDSIGSVLDPDINIPNNITKFSNNQSNQTVGLYDSMPFNLTTVANAPLSATATRYEACRESIDVVNGPQTPKPIQPPLEIWNKLRFWFNDDVRLSVPSVSIPFGQRYITIELANQSDLVFEYPSLYIKMLAYTSQYCRQEYTPYFQLNGIETMTMEKIELYINNIFVNPEIHDIYIKRIGFSLIRVYRQHNQTCNQSNSEEKLLSQLKWPIEYMFVGLRPRWNITNPTNKSGTAIGSLNGNEHVWRDWHRLTKNTKSTFKFFINPINVCDTLNVIYTVDHDAIRDPTYYLPVSTVDSLSLTSHGITIFDSFNDIFFNQYMPYHYGGAALNTPDDTGALFINFALFPRSYQPSGHLNISRARETYLKWNTTYITPNTPADLFVCAIAINFLLISDGSCVLRYST